MSPTRSTTTAAIFEVDTTVPEAGTTTTSMANETPSDKVTKTAIHTSGSVSYLPLLGLAPLHDKLYCRAGNLQGRKA